MYLPAPPCTRSLSAGKTLLAKSLAKFVQVPFAMADATSLTQVRTACQQQEHAVDKLHARLPDGMQRRVGERLRVGVRCRASGI